MSAVTFGDIHLTTDERVMTNMDNLLSKLIPENVFLHDVFDGYSINVHEQKTVAFSILKKKETKFIRRWIRWNAWFLTILH